MRTETLKTQGGPGDEANYELVTMYAHIICHSDDCYSAVSYTHCVKSRVYGSNSDKFYASLREVRDKSLLGDMYSDDDYELSMMSLYHADWAISSTTLAIVLAVVCAILATCSLVLLKMYHVKVGILNRDLSIILV